MTPSIEIAQALRKSHCSHKDQGKDSHKCVGSCKITPKGIELSCPLCGDDKQSNLPQYMSDPRIIKRAKRICAVIGLEFDNMPDSVQKAIVDEIFRDFCPNCKSMFVMHRDYISCSCGWNYSEYRGWYNTEKNTDSTKPKDCGAYDGPWVEA